MQSLGAVDHGAVDAHDHGPRAEVVAVLFPVPTLDESIEFELARGEQGLSLGNTRCSVGDSQRPHRCPRLESGLELAAHLTLHAARQCTCIAPERAAEQSLQTEHPVATGGDVDVSGAMGDSGLEVPADILSVRVHEEEVFSRVRGQSLAENIGGWLSVRQGKGILLGLSCKLVVAVDEQEVARGPNGSPELPLQGSAVEFACPAKGKRRVARLVAGTHAHPRPIATNFGPLGLKLIARRDPVSAHQSREVAIVVETPGHKRPSSGIETLGTEFGPHLLHDHVVATPVALYLRDQSRVRVVRRDPKLLAARWVPLDESKRIIRCVVIYRIQICLEGRASRGEFAPDRHVGSVLTRSTHARPLLSEGLRRSRLDLKLLLRRVAEIGSIRSNIVDAGLQQLLSLPPRGLLNVGTVRDGRSRVASLVPIHAVVPSKRLCHVVQIDCLVLEAVLDVHLTAVICTVRSQNLFYVQLLTTLLLNLQQSHGRWAMPCRILHAYNGPSSPWGVQSFPVLG